MMSKLKKDHDKKPWLPLCLLSLLFYGAMLLLTLFAKDIHHARLPQVTAERPGKQEFAYSITIDNYTLERTSFHTALPKNMVDADKVFIIKTVMEDDFTYYYAQQVFVTIDSTKENTDYYVLSGGLDSRDMVILTGYDTLSDGEEVYLIQKKTTKKEELNTDNLFQ